MNKLSSLIRAYPVVAVTLVVGAIAGILTLLGYPTPTQIAVTVYVGGFSLWTAIGMVRDMLRGHFGLDILALVAMVSTLAVGEYWASIIIVLMLSGGEALEDFAANHAKRELTALLDRSPTEAHLVTADDEYVDVPVDQVAIGDVLLVRPSETVPVDSEVLSDSGTFDESSITGESLPVSRRQGQEVPSGAINGSQAVRVRALRLSADSQYQQIVRLVKESESAKAPMVRLADRYAIPFTAAALLIAGIAWAVSGNPVRFAEVLVLATPCPLLIAAPVAFMGGMSRASKAGVIVKGGAVLEQAARVRSVAFDKTGTLTQGRPQVVDLRPADGFTADELLTLAASAEQYSTHVLADGIREAARDLPLTTASSAEEAPALGVQALINGHRVRVGQFAYVAEAAADAALAEIGTGQVAAYVARGDQFVGAVVLSDSVRPETAGLLQWLRSEKVDTLAMVTGDSQATASAVAAELGITDVHAHLRPADKVALVSALSPQPTMMIGDGINDAPVLAAADVGVAMGAKGSTAAGEAADAVILQDSLAPVASLVSISRDTVRVALAAIWIGVVASIALMLVATTGIIPAVVGALLQEVLDLVAILYALRALTGTLPVVESSRVERSRLLSTSVR